MKNRSDELMKEIRAQLNQVMSELDKAADRNITILEGCIDELRIVVSQADKRLRLFALQKENDTKHKKHYSGLKQKKILQPDLFGADKKVASGGDVKKTGSPKKSKPSASPSDVNLSQNLANNSVQLDSGDAVNVLVSELENETKMATDKIENEMTNNESVEKDTINKELSHKEKRAQVVDLFGVGQSIKEISETLDITIGEVELIISLRTKKNHGMPGR